MAQRGMFQSARVKLTLFYLAGLLVMSLGATMTIRFMAEREYLRSNNAQLGEVRHITQAYLYYLRRPDQSFANLQDDQASLVRAHLNEDLIAFNVLVLLFGGAVSYWFAGRTLRPIEEAHKAQARFTADASHELRTPLTNMKLENEVFLRQKQFTEQEARAQIESNLEEVERLAKLSQNLLDLTHFGQVALTLRQVKVSELIERAVQGAARSAELRQVRIASDDVAQAKVCANAESMVQLLGILLDNAIKYGPEKGTVTLAGKRFGADYVITVSDEGPGVSTHDLPHIFDRLYRGDKARSSSVGGYGLGLSVAQEIARANNVSIAAKNDPNGGAIFGVKFDLPRDSA